MNGLAVDRGCEFCGHDFSPSNSRQRFCSATCRVKAHNARHRGGEVIPLKTSAPKAEPKHPSARVQLGPVEKATRKVLQEAKRLDTPLGATCLALAHRLDVPSTDTGSALASVARALDDMLTKATRGAGVRTAPDLLKDELAARRAEKGSA